MVFKRGNLRAAKFILGGHVSSKITLSKCSVCHIGKLEVTDIEGLALVATNTYLYLLLDVLMCSTLKRGR